MDGDRVTLPGSGDCQTSFSCEMKVKRIVRDPEAAAAELEFQGGDDVQILFDGPIWVQFTQAVKFIKPNAVVTLTLSSKESEL